MYVLPHMQAFYNNYFPLLAPATATAAIIKAITIINDMYIPYLNILETPSARWRHSLRTAAGS